MFKERVWKGVSVIIVITMVLSGFSTLALSDVGKSMDYGVEVNDPVMEDSSLGSVVDDNNNPSDDVSQKESKLNSLLDSEDGIYPVPSALPIDEDALFGNGAALDYNGINDAWAKGYGGEGVNVAVVDTGVDFAHIDLQGTQATVNDTNSPYNGWPIAYDPQSMSSYLDTGSTDDTWYADTSRVGPGPFELEHTIDVDGASDFKDEESWAKSISEPDTFDYDLGNLYMTYDQDNWYTGFNIKPVTDNVTVGLFIDVDNSTSGSTIAPGGKLVDTNTSHSDFINDIAFSPDGKKLASVSDDFTIKIWDVETGVLLKTLKGHNAKPASVVWTPDSQSLASVDLSVFIVWNTTTGDEKYRVSYTNPTIDRIAALDVSTNGTWLTVGAKNNIEFYDIAAGTWFGTMWVSSANINTMAFDPVDPTQLAVGSGAGGKEISVYTLNSTNINTTSKNPGFKATPLYSLKGHSAALTSIAWSSDATKMVSGGGNDIKLWNSLVTTESTFVPLNNGTSDNTGEADLTDLANDDGAYPAVPGTPASSDGWYTVTPGNTMHIEGFDIPQSVEGHIQSVTLSVQYDVNSTGGFTESNMKAGLDPNDDPGTPIAYKPAIKPLTGERNTAADMDLVSLPLAINTFDDLRTLDIWYTNGGDDDIVSFDYIWLNVSYIPGKTLKNHTSTITSVDWSMDDTRISSSSVDATVKVWDSGGNLQASIDTMEITNSATWSSQDPDLLAYSSNDLSVRLWNASTEVQDTIFVAQKPDYAIYVNMGMRYDTKEDIDVPFIKNVTKYTWDTGTWKENSLVEIGGSWAYEVDATGEAFVEFFTPKSQLGDAEAFSVQLFSTGNNVSRAQDTSPDDKNVGDKLNWSSTPTSLSNFVYGYIEKYTVDPSIVSMANSTDFHFGFHPGSRIITSSLGSGILVIESSTKGIYDKVFLDFNNDFIFDTNDVNVSKDNPIVAYDNYNSTVGAQVNETIGPDGIPDKSGGMLYFMSQAKEIDGEVPAMDDAMTLGTLANGNIIPGSVALYLNGTLYISVKEASEGPELSEDLTVATLKFGDLVDESTVMVFINETQYTGEYTIDLVKGIIRFADPLPSKDGVIVNYSYYGLPYSLDLEKGNITFDDPLHDTDIITVDYQYDGVSIPYSDVYTEREGKDNIIPTNGDLLAFMGEFSKDPNTKSYTTHGTMVASAISGQGRMADQPIVGSAPDAKIIAIGNFASKTSNVIDAWYFAVEGYDGIQGTGDEAQIVANAFNYQNIYEDGWDKYSRMADYISMTYSNGSALFVASAGDAGYGYGSISSPASGPNVIAVGDATDFTSDANTLTNISFDVDGKGGVSSDGSEGVNPHYGEVQMSSSRGPTPGGTPKPEILAIGSGLAAVPLHKGDGADSTYDFWIGTEHSSAITTGALALMFQAYHETNGIYPDVTTARSLLMSGAEDMGADVLTQGAGFLNASRSIDLAIDAYGTSVSPSMWVPGGFNGNRYESFAKLMVPGESDDMTFNLNNHGAATDVDISTKTFRKTEEYSYLNETFTFKYKDMENNEHLLLDRDIAIVVNETGVYALNTSAEDQMVYGDLSDSFGNQAYPTGMKIMDVNATAWSNADLIKVSASADYSLIMGDKDIKHNYGMVLYDWENQMGRYLDWLKTNNAPAHPLYGVASAPWIPEVTPGDYAFFDLPGPLYVNGTPECTFPLMNNGALNTFNLSNWEDDMTNLIAPTGDPQDKLFGLNTLSEGSGTNVLEARVSNPADKVQDGLVIYLASNDGINDLPWNITIEFYENQDWDWVDVNGPSTLGLAENSSTSFDVTATVPSDAPVGSYEGGIYITQPEWIINERVINYPLYSVYDEEIANVTIYDVADELVVNITSTDAQLANGSITGTPSIRKVNNVVNDSFFGPATGVELGPFLLGNTSIINCTVYLKSTTSWYKMKGDIDYTLNSATGEIDTTLWGSLSSGDILYAYYNYTTTLISPADYTLDYTTGKITLTNPLNVGEYLIANYSWYIPIFSAQLSHGNIFNCTLYLNGTVFTNYTLNYTTGSINFITPLGPDDVINASYIWYYPDTMILDAMLKKRDIVPGSYNIFDRGIEITNYSIDLDNGVIFFDNPLWIEAVITATYSFYTPITIPVLINVASDVLDMEFGGSTSDNLFNNNEIYGGNLKSVDANKILTMPYSGDWRYYYVNVPDQGLFAAGGLTLYVNVEWSTKPSDNDIYVFSQTDADEPSLQDKSRYGPYTLENQGGSEEADDIKFFTSTNATQDTVALSLRTGLNVIAVHNVILNGSSYKENIWGEVGWLSLSSSNVKIYANELNGKATVNMVSNRDLKGTGASVLGPASSESFKDLEVWQESAADMAAQDAASSWKDYIYTLRFSSYQKIIQVEKAATLEVHIMGHPADDLDFGIFYDHNMNGEIDIEDLIDSSFTEFITYNTWGQAPFAVGADADGDEKVKLISPPDGQYIIAVYGWGVSTGGVEPDGVPAYFDMDISMIVAGVAGYGLEGFPEEDLAPGPSDYESDMMLPAFSPATFNVTWDFPGSASDGEFGGVLNLGTQNAPELASVQVTIVIDREAPEILDETSPSENSIIKDTNPLILASIEDLERGEIDADGIRLSVDGIDVTPLTKISVDRDGISYPRGTISYTPAEPLSEGGHVAELWAADFAGNIATKIWIFTVDTLAPKLTLDNPSYAYVADESYTVSGETESDVALVLSVGATKYYPVVMDDGRFSQILELPSDIVTDIIVEAEDQGGNVARQTLKIASDTMPSVLSNLKSSNGYLTNKDLTTISGNIDEPGELRINGDAVETSSTGSFDQIIDLAEGTNIIEISVTDLAGNTFVDWMNITKDTVAPIIDIDIPDQVNNGIINISGKVLSGYSVKVNGKVPSTDSTRDGDIDFSKSLSLSYGLNTIVIEAKDDAGNVQEFRHTVEYTAEDPGTNYAAIGLMMILLIVGLLVGLFIAMAIWKEKPEEEEVEPIEGEEDISPVDEDMETGGEMLSEEDMEPDIDEEPMIIGDEEAEAIVSEDDISAYDEEPMDIGDEPIDLEEEPDDMADIPEDTEPIPMEEGLPEDIEEDPAEMDDIPEDADIEEPESETHAEPEAPIEEDERIIRLRQAFEDGKISEELYNKNLAKLQE